MTITHRTLLAAALCAGLALPGLSLAQDVAPAAADATAAPTETTAAPTPETPSNAAKPAADAPIAAPANGAIGPAPRDKAQIIFFRPGKYTGALLSFSVHDGQTGIGKLGNGTYFVDLAEPGSHTFTIQSEATDSLTLEVDAGETYYVKQTIAMGIMMGRPKLAPSDQAEFERSKLKLSNKKPTDLKPKA